MPYHKTELGTLYQGNCAEVLKGLPDNSIDTVICDPPYGLSKEPDIAEVMRHWIDGDDYKQSGGGFMGKTWDSFVPNPSLWREVYRVLKPGGTALVFAGNRTQDLMTISLRFAGFQIFDIIMYMYGSGFPKSLNISKSIDKLQRGVPHGGSDPTSPNHGKYKSGCSDSNPSGQGFGAGPGSFMVEQGTKDNRELLPEAQKWEGWGTALKPAYEPIICARKKCEGTYAENALKHGVAGLHIDGSRVGYQSQAEYNKLQQGRKSNRTIRAGEVAKGYGMKPQGLKDTNQSTKGRFPANIILECICDNNSGVHTDPNCSCRMLDEQSGDREGCKPHLIKSKVTNYEGWGSITQKNSITGFDDKGGASRFFYTAKASKSERDLGCESLEGEYQSIRNNRKCKICGHQEVSGSPCKCNNPDWEIIERKTIVKNDHPCLSPDTLIVTQDGYKQIRDVTIGELVYSNDGKFHKVIDVSMHKYNEPIFDIKVKGTNINVLATHNHPFLIYRPTRHKNCIIDYKIEWQEAENINVGDYTLTPLLQEETIIPDIVDPNYWFVMGLWLAEGSFQNAGHGKNRYPVFVLHKNEIKLIKRIKKVSTKKVSVYKHGNNAVAVMIFDPKLAEIYYKHCNRYSYSKKISMDIYRLPKELKQAFLDGYISGDGCKIKTYLQAKTVSPHIAYQIKLLGESLNYTVNVFRYECSKNAGIGTRKFKSTRTEYNIRLYNKNINSIDKKPSKPTIIKHNGIWYRLNYIKSVDKISYNGDVVNLSVNGSPTFQTSIGMSHNTVKPVALIEYLCRLTATPTGGVVLDPFFGSGTLGVVCERLGRQWIGIELSKEYCEIAKARINHTYKEETMKEQMKLPQPSHSILEDDEI